MTEKENAGSESEFQRGVIELESKERQKHPKCLGTYDEHNGDYDCEYDTNLTCDECKYGAGRKDPAAKCNAL